MDHRHWGWGSSAGQTFLLRSSQRAQSPVEASSPGPPHGMDRDHWDGSITTCRHVDGSTAASRHS